MTGMKVVITEGRYAGQQGRVVEIYPGGTGALVRLDTGEEVGFQMSRLEVIRPTR